MARKREAKNTAPKQSRALLMKLVAAASGLRSTLVLGPTAKPARDAQVWFERKANEIFEYREVLLSRADPLAFARDQFSRRVAYLRELCELVNSADPDALAQKLVDDLVRLEALTQRGKNIRPRTASISARMLERIQNDHASRGWTARQWAKTLKCSLAGVCDSKAWKELQKHRLSQGSDRASSKRHNRRSLA